MFKNLIIKLHRLLIDQVVVKAYAIGWLDDIALRINAVLGTSLGRILVLTFELLFLLDRVVVMGDQTRGRRYFKLADPTVVQLINGFIEGLTVDVLPVSLKLLISLLELVPERLCRSLMVVIVESVLWVAIDVEVLHERVLKRGLVLPKLILHLIEGIRRLLNRCFGRGQVPSRILSLKATFQLLNTTSSAIVQVVEFCVLA